MTEWIKWSEKKPSRKQYCDFIYAGDEGENGVWMLCDSRREKALMYDGTPVYWRPAEPLPEGVTWHEDEECTTIASTS